jgi:erythromycin esterase-like protein
LGWTCSECIVARSPSCGDGPAERAIHIKDLDAADPRHLAPLDGQLAGKRLVFLGEADHFRR